MWDFIVKYKWWILGAIVLIALIVTSATKPSDNPIKSHLAEAFGMKSK